MTTGLVMFVHLHDAEHCEHDEHHENHDHDNCQICQQFLFSSKKVIIEPQTIIQNIELYAHYVQLNSQEIISIVKLQSSCPRAPPVI
jgi:hypothetical protein